MGWEDCVDDMAGPAGAEGDEASEDDEKEESGEEEADAIDGDEASPAPTPMPTFATSAGPRRPAPRTPGPTAAEEAVAGALGGLGGFGDLGLGSVLYPAERFRDAETIGYKALADLIERTERTLRARDKTYPALMIHTWWAETPTGEYVYVDTHEDLLDQRHKAGSYHVRIKASPEPDQEHPGDLYYACDVAIAPPDGREGGPLGVNLALLRTTEELKADNTELREKLRGAEKKIDKLRRRLRDVEDALHEAERDKRDLEAEVQRLEAAEAGAPWIDDALAEQGMMSAVSVMQSWAENPGGKPQARLEQIWNAVYQFFAGLGATPVLPWLAEHRPKAWDKLVRTLNQIATEEQAPPEMRFLTSEAIMRQVRVAQVGPARGLPGGSAGEAGDERGGARGSDRGTGPQARRDDQARDARREGRGQERRGPHTTNRSGAPSPPGGTVSPWRRDREGRGRPRGGPEAPRRR